MTTLSTRPVMADTSYKQSSFYTGPDGLMKRLEMAMLDDEIAKKLEREAEIKAGKEYKDAYRGISERDTSLVQRITAQTFNDTNSSEYRTAERINTSLREQAQRLQEDMAAQKKYMKDMQDYLN